MKATLFKDISDASEIIELEIGKPLYSCFRDDLYINRIAIVNGIEKSLDYIIQEDDVVIIRTIPGGSAIAVVYIVVLAVSAGVAVYSGVQAYKARKQAEELADKMKNIDSEITNIPYIKGASNATATGKSQPYIIGKHLFTPYKLAEGFNVISGTYGIDQYYYIVLQGGFNKQVLRKVYCDDILIKTFSESLTIPQEGIDKFDKKSIFNNGNSRIEIAQDGNDFGIVQFNKKVVTQSTGDEIKKADAADYEELIYSLEANTRSADICIMFNGLRAYNNSGDKISRSVTLVPEYSLDSGGHWTMFTFVQEGIPNNTFTYNLSQQLRFNAHVDFNYSSVKNLTEPILIRLNCTTPSYDGSAMDNVYVQWVQSYIYNPDNSAIVNDFVDEKPIEANEMAVSTLIGLKIKATLSNQEKLNKINVRTAGVARTWNGTAWSTTKVPTSNPAAWLLEVLTSPTHKASMCSDDEIDLPSFGELYTYCETNSLHCNVVLTNGDTKESVLSMILDTCNSIMYHDIYGKISIATDKAKENAIAVINTQNALSFKNKKDLARYTDGIRINYINANEDYDEDSYLVMRDGETRTSDSLIREITVTGIEEYTHIVKYARRLLAIDKLRPKTTSVTIGKEGVYYTPLGKVLVQHPSLKIGLGSAEIKSIMVVGANIVGLELYEPIQYDDTIASGFGVLIQAVSDEYCTTLAKAYTADNGLVTEIAFTTPIALSATTIPHAGDILSYGYLNSGAFDTITSPMMITGIEPNQEGYTLTLVDYDEAIYSTGTIPDYTPNITSRKTPLALPIDIPSATKDELAGAVSLISLGNEVSIPDDITILYVIAGEERIDIEWSWEGRGLNNNIANYVVEISKNNGVTWATIGLPLQTSSEYVFNRDIDGYPEKDILADWKIRVKAVNIYGKESAHYKTVYVDLTHYGTWKPAVLAIMPYCSGRDAVINCDAARQYGQLGYHFQIARTEEMPTDADWRKPAITLDSRASEGNYTDGTDGFLFTTINQLSQSLPLKDQTIGLPKDTKYWYRVRGVSFVPTSAHHNPSDIESLSVGAWSDAYGILARPTGNIDIVESAIHTAQIAPNAVTLERLNVVARNKVNSFVNESDGEDGWTLPETSQFDVVDSLRCLRVTSSDGSATGLGAISDPFEVLPDELVEFSFGIQCSSDNPSTGLYVGLTYGQHFTRYLYDSNVKKWNIADNGTNEYFLFDYKSTTRRNFRTYILGSNVDVSSVPAPAITDSYSTISCLKLFPGDTKASLRTSANATTPGTWWRIILPQAYTVGSGKIVAGQMLVRDLSAINANLGDISGDDPDAFRLTGNSGYSAPAGTFLLGKSSASSYLRRWYDSVNGVWRMAIKLATFIVDSVSSSIFGRFKIFRAGDNPATGIPIFESNPGSAAGSESTTVRGALRVKKSTTGDADGETEIFNVTPNGDAFLKGRLDGKARGVYIDNVLVKGREGIQVAQNYQTSGVDFASPTPDWYSHIILNHPNAGGYYQDIMACFNSDNVFLRRMANGALSSFRRFLFDGDTVSTLAVNSLNGISPLNYVRYDGWVSSPGIDANAMAINRVGFTYSNNAPYAGPIIYLGSGNNSPSSESDYGIQINTCYSGSPLLAFRTHNGDNGTWSPWAYFISLNTNSGENDVDFPIGTVVYCANVPTARNVSVNVYLDTDARTYAVNTGAGARLAGVWRSCGGVADSSVNRCVCRRVG